MKRQFNYTNRKRIPREKVEIVLRDQGREPPAFDAKIDLSDLGLPDWAKVFIEAYYRNSYMRFDFGTVANICCKDNRTLHDIDNRELIYFRVKVVDLSGEHGKLLAEADRISASPANGGGTRICILEVKFEDLGNQAWSLDLPDGATPTLVVNRKMGSREYVRSDTTFFALVYPAVVREILTRIVLIEDGHEPDVDSEDWKDRWLYFIRTLPGVDPLPEGDDELAKVDWIESAVRAFCESQAACRDFIEARAREGAA